MDARATFGGRHVSTGTIATFVIAVVIALVLGGAAGYVVRAMSLPNTAPSVTVTHPQPSPVRTLLPGASL